MKPASTAAAAEAQRNSPKGEAKGGSQAPTQAAITQPGMSPWEQPPLSWIYSLRVGIVLLAIVTVASIIGTAIDPLSRAQRLIYYTWWFKLLLLALAVNMGGATVRTLVKKVLPSRPLRIQKNPAYFSLLPLSGRYGFQGTAEEVGRVFRKRGFAVKVEGNAGVARSGWFAKFGAPISHLGMVIVLIAGFASSWVAREGIVKALEGQTVTQMTIPNLDPNKPDEVVDLGFSLTIDDFSTGYFPRTRIPSHFTSYITAESPSGELLYTGPVEVNHSPRLNGWLAHQSSYQEMQGMPRFNLKASPPSPAQPVTLEMTPGQSRALPGMDGVTLALASNMDWSIVKGTEKLASGSLAGGAGSGISLQALQFEPDFVLGDGGAAMSRTQELNNPALRVQLSNGGAPVGRPIWLFGRDDMKAFSHSSDPNYSMELVDVQGSGSPSFTVQVSDAKTGAILNTIHLHLGETKVVIAAGMDDTKEAAAGIASDWKVENAGRVTAHATVMTMTRNPAIPVIYGGCTLMMLGLVIGFFLRRREVWFMVDNQKGELLVAAQYRHPSDEFDHATKAALSHLNTSAVS